MVNISAVGPAVVVVVESAGGPAEGLVFWLVPMPSFWGASVGALVVVTMALVATVALVGTVGGNVVDFRSKVGNQGKDLRA